MGEFPFSGRRYGEVRRWVKAGAVAVMFLLPCGPAGATSVADVLDALAALQVPAGMGAEDWRAYRAAHEAGLQRAHATLALAHAVEEAVLATGSAAFLRTGVPLLCNYDEEARAGFPELADLFVAEGARRHGMDPAAARSRLLQAAVEEMMPVALLARYPCPVNGPGSPPTAAPR